MKHPLLLLAFLICLFKQGKASKIDSLKTDRDVERFISALFQQKNKMSYYSFNLAKPDSVNSYYACDSTINLETGRWEKIDFNEDGLTDLFAIVYQRDTLNSKVPEYKVYVVIDQGNNKFQLNEIPEYFMMNCYSIKPILVNNHPCLRYRYYKTEETVEALPGVDTSGGSPVPRIKVNYFEVGRTDTLIHKFGGFIELTRINKNTPAIESIYFSTTPCFGTCPVFNLNIFKDRTAYYLRDDSFEESAGNFRTTINQTQWNEITELIKYINISELKDNYFFSATDMQSSKLMIYFSDGSKKGITDYGLQGTLGLVRLYNLLFALRFNQQWR